MARMTRTGGALLAPAIALAVACAALPLAGGAAEARGAHRGSGYGLAGGLSPDLALANVYSGIYGVPYTYDRATYRFDRCPPVPTAGSQSYTIRGCGAFARP